MVGLFQWSKSYARTTRIGRGEKSELHNVSITVWHLHGWSCEENDKESYGEREIVLKTIGMKCPREVNQLFTYDIIVLAYWVGNINRLAPEFMNISEMKRK